MEKLTLDMIDKISTSFTKAFNSQPWNDSWAIEQAKERLTDIYNTPKFDGAVEIIEGKIAAVIMGAGQRYYDGIHFEILEFWVDKSFQGQGLGKKKLSSFLEQLKSQGIYNYYLMTLREKSTEGFYKKQGFSTDQNMCIMHN